MEDDQDLSSSPSLTLQITPSQSKIKTSTRSKSWDCGSESFRTFALRREEEVKAAARRVVVAPRNA